MGQIGQVLFRPRLLVHPGRAARLSRLVDYLLQPLDAFRWPRHSAGPDVRRLTRGKFMIPLSSPTPAGGGV